MGQLLTIPFHNQNLIAVEHGGKPYIAMRPIVENLGLAWGAQQQKITERFNSVVSMIDTTGADGKRYQMLCLPLSKIAAFLYSINPSKVKPELRETVIAYQEECDDVLFKHFFSYLDHKNHKLADEKHALIEHLFKSHPQWRQTANYYSHFVPAATIARLQGKHVSSVNRMIKRIIAAGIVPAHTKH